jgi:trans-aconitate 2-methyltransferase
MSDVASDVRTFYDKFLIDRMVGYRLFGNKRIEEAAHFVVRNVRSDDLIVDIGCGIGIATEAVAKHAKRGRVIGVDISKENVWYASKTVKLRNLEFHCLDVIREHEKLASLTKRPVDVFVLCDVIEHLPDDVRHTIFQTMSGMGSPDVKIIITYPSPYYQNYLKEHDQKELQIIDNVITLDQLSREAAQHGLEVTAFELKDIWRPAQYVHCLLRRSSSIQSSIGELTEQTTNPPGLYRRLSRGMQKRVRWKLENYILVPMRRRRYISKVLGRNGITRSG